MAIVGNYLLGLLLVLSASLAQAEPLRMVYFDQFPPMSYVVAGEPRGAWVDIMAELARRLDMPVQHSAYPWARAQAMVKEGLADGMITVVTPERLSYALPVEGLIAIGRNRVFTYRDHPRMAELQAIREPADLKPFRIVSYFGNGWVRNYLGEFQIDWRGSDMETLHLLALRRYDLTVGNPSMIEALSAKLGLQRVIVAVGEPMPSYQYQLLIGKKSVYAADVERFAKALHEMQRDGMLAQILARYPR